MSRNISSPSQQAQQVSRLPAQGASQKSQPSSDMAGRAQLHSGPLPLRARGLSQGEGNYNPVPLYQRKAEKAPDWTSSVLSGTQGSNGQAIGSELVHGSAAGTAPKDLVVKKGSVDATLASKITKKIESNQFSKADRMQLGETIKSNLKAPENIWQAASERSAWNSLNQVFEYTENAQKDFDQLTTLSNKWNKTGKLSGKEKKQFTQLLWTHRENIPVLQEHLASVREGLGDELGLTQIVDSAITVLANQHMALANTMSLHSEHLPDRPATSRDERLGFHLLEAQGNREAIAALKKSYPDDVLKQRKLDGIDQKLAAHETSLRKLKDEGIPRDPKDLDLLLKMPVRKKGDISAKAKRELETSLQSGKNLPIARRDMTQRQMINLFLRHELKNAGFDMRSLPDLKFLQKQGFIQAVNKKPWPKIDHEINVKIGAQSGRFRSVITPAAAHSKDLARPYRGSGVGAEDRLQCDHAINLARTSLTNSSGQEVFKAHRSGVLDAYDMTPKNLAKMSDSALKDLFKTLLTDRGRDSAGAEQLVKRFRTQPDEARRLARLVRQEASKVMAEDVAATMLLDDPDLLKQALEGKEVTLPITSISLMTPDYLRELSSKGGEKTMLLHHEQGLQHLRNQGVMPIELTLGQGAARKKVSVRVEPRVMSFGVNAGALRGLGVVSGNRLPFWRRLMGWGFSTHRNEPVLTDMVGARNDGSVGGRAAKRIDELHEQQDAIMQKLESPNLDSDARLQETQKHKELVLQEAKLTQLAGQVKDIWNNGNYVREGQDPYKMVARVAMLSDALGDKTLFHCKSGKDRTGQLDAEAKYLSAVFDQTGFIPTPDQAPLPKTRRLRTLFALKTGNHEMQRYNTGLAGFKLKGVPALDAQFESSALPAYRGGSALIDS